MVIESGKIPTGFVSQTNDVIIQLSLTLLESSKMFTMIHYLYDINKCQLNDRTDIDFIYSNIFRIIDFSFTFYYKYYTLHSKICTR